MSIYVPAMERELMKAALINLETAEPAALVKYKSGLSDYLFNFFRVGVMEPASRKGYDLLLADHGSPPDQGLETFGRDGFKRHVGMMLGRPNIKIEFALSKYDSMEHLGCALILSPADRCPIEMSIDTMYKPPNNPSNPVRIYRRDIYDPIPDNGSESHDIMNELAMGMKQGWVIDSDGVKDIEHNVSKSIDEYEKVILPLFVKRNPDRYSLT
jgi:hypothetical protein